MVYDTLYNIIVQAANVLNLWKYSNKYLLFCIVLQLKLHIRCTWLVFSNFTNLSKLSLHISKNMSKRKAETENPNAEFCDFLMGKLTNVTGFYGIFFFFFLHQSLKLKLKLSILKLKKERKLLRSVNCHHYVVGFLHSFVHVSSVPKVLILMRV